MKNTSKGSTLFVISTLDLRTMSMPWPAAAVRNLLPGLGYSTRFDGVIPYISKSPSVTRLNENDSGSTKIGISAIARRSTESLLPSTRQLELR